MISKGKKFFIKSEAVQFSKKKKKINLRPLFFLIVTGAFAYFIFFSSCFRINNFIYEGIESSDIKDAVRDNLTGKNILFLMPGSYLAKLSKQFPALEEATIVRGLPHTIKVTAKERSQSLVWCNSSGCAEVDSDGVAFKKIDKPQDKVALTDLMNRPIVNGNKIISKSFVAFYLESLNQIPKKFNVKIKEAQIEETTFSITLIFDDGKKIILDSSQSLENQMYALEQTLQSKKDEIKEYVDIRVPGTVYFK